MRCAVVLLGCCWFPMASGGAETANVSIETDNAGTQYRVRLTAVSPMATSFDQNAFGPEDTVPGGAVAVFKDESGAIIMWGENQTEYTSRSMHFSGFESTVELAQIPGSGEVASPWYQTAMLLWRSDGSVARERWHSLKIRFSVEVRVSTGDAQAVSGETDWIAVTPVLLEALESRETEIRRRNKDIRESKDKRF